MKLTNELKGKNVKINKLNFEDSAILHKLNNIGISENSEIKVLDYDQNNKVVHLLVYGVEYVLRERDCYNIDVTPI
ncbi:MAG: ferrous iron transport protein A [Mycoplasmoidaceae bacterium]|nr:ferrous iron transport protein A [Mycoplasmoidaceae bacterium]